MAPQTAVDAKPARPSSLKPASVSSSQPSATAEPAKPAAETATVNLPSAPQPVEFHGCKSVRDDKGGRVCMLTPDDKLVFWVRDRACDSLAFAEGGQAISFTGSIVQGGCQALITSSTTQVHTALQISDRTTALPIYSLPLDRSQPQLLAGTIRLETRSGGDLEEVVPELQRRLAVTQDTETRIDILYSLARITRRIGDDLASQRYLSATMQEALNAGYRSIAFSAGYRLADQLELAGMHDESRKILHTMENIRTPGESRSITFLAWEHALLDRAETRFLDAVQGISVAMAAMERVNDAMFERVAISIQTELLLRIGRVPDAKNLLRRAEELRIGANDCGRAELSLGVAFIGLLVAETTADDGTQIPIRVGQNTLRDLFLRALQERNKCRNDRSLANLYKGMATVELLENHYQEAQTCIEQARKLGQVGAISDMELIDLQARIALASRNGKEALRLYRSLEEHSRKNASHFRDWMECKYALGMYRSLQLMGADGGVYIGKIQACIASDNGAIPKVDVQRFLREARNSGISRPQ